MLTPRSAGSYTRKDSILRARPDATGSHTCRGSRETQKKLAGSSRFTTVFQISVRERRSGAPRGELHLPRGAKLGLGPLPRGETHRPLVTGVSSSAGGPEIALGLGAEGEGFCEAESVEVAPRLASALPRPCMIEAGCKTASRPSPFYIIPRWIDAPLTGVYDMHFRFSSSSNS